MSCLCNDLASMRSGEVNLGHNISIKVKGWKGMDGSEDTLVYCFIPVMVRMLICLIAAV